MHTHTHTRMPYKQSLCDTHTSACVDHLLTALHKSPTCPGLRLLLRRLTVAVLVRACHPLSLSLPGVGPATLHYSAWLESTSNRVYWQRCSPPSPVLLPHPLSSLTSCPPSPFFLSLTQSLALFYFPLPFLWCYSFIFTLIPIALSHSFSLFHLHSHSYLSLSLSLSTSSPSLSLSLIPVSLSSSLPLFLCPHCPLPCKSRQPFLTPWDLITHYSATIMNQHCLYGENIVDVIE